MWMAVTGLRSYDNVYQNFPYPVIFQYKLCNSHSYEKTPCKKST